MLRGLAENEKWRDNADIQLALANGAFNAMNRYGSAQQWDELERWGDVLRGLAENEKWRDNGEIQLELAKGAFNAMCGYGTAQQWEQLERWGGRLQHSLSRAPMDEGLFNVMIGIAMRLAVQKGDPRTSRIVLCLAEYWPGFLVSHEDDHVPLAILAGALSHWDASQRERLEKLSQQRRETWQHVESIQQSLNDEKVPDVEAVRYVWQHRMYFPDRGERLLPLLLHLRMEKELAEAAADPWRRGESR